MVAFTPVLMVFPANLQEEWADTPSELTQMEWDGWVRKADQPVEFPKSLAQRVAALEAGGGGDGPGGYVHTQSSPSASWSITNPLGRIPAVDLYVAGQQVEADVEATTTTVSVTFPAPTAGLAVLA